MESGDRPAIDKRSGPRLKVVAHYSTRAGLFEPLMRDVVLLLTHSGDFYTVDLVSQALARRGVRPIRFNTDLFPSLVNLSARAGDKRAAQLFTETAEEISVDKVRAVWARKLWSPRMSDDLDERYRAMCATESAAALECFLDALHHAHWVNDLNHQRNAENKQRQLRLAARAGLHLQSHAGRCPGVPGQRDRRWRPAHAVAVDDRSGVRGRPYLAEQPAARTLVCS